MNLNDYTIKKIQLILFSFCLTSFFLSCSTKSMEEQDLIINKLPADAMEKWRVEVDKGVNKLMEEYP